MVAAAAAAGPTTTQVATVAIVPSEAVQRFFAVTFERGGLYYCFCYFLILIQTIHLMLLLVLPFQDLLVRL